MSADVSYPVSSVPVAPPPPPPEPPPPPAAQASPPPPPPPPPKPAGDPDVGTNVDVLA